ncbi:MAG: hypothetical protein LBK56_12855 [Gracilibacteraceae bacterium]|jgi:2-keto-3-deoxy-L-rhamnonate aldolase RhmA|nr:hypothetical protein [Gracilibacteraceae bacterium]
MTIKERLLNGEKLLGSFITIRSLEVAEMMCRAGFDYIVIDAEHCAYDWSDIDLLIRVIKGSGVYPIVRIMSITRQYVLRVLDMGADGIMAPRVDTVDDAKALVQFAKYPPMGDRGSAGVVRAAQYGRIPLREAIETANKNTLLIVQAETPGAVDSAGDIAAVDGIDMLFVGPNDLSVSMGYPGQMGAPAVQAKIESALLAAQARNKLCGIYAVSPDDVAKWTGKGVQFVITGVAGLIRTGIEKNQAELRAAVKV